MSIDQLNTILQQAAANPPPENSSPIELRKWFEAAYADLPLPDSVIMETVSLGPIGGEFFQFPGCDNRKLVIYYHGGGFMFGSTRTHRTISANLARVTGTRVLSVDYRLAPEFMVPTAHDDAYAAYVWALEQGYNAGNISVGGDSAGGNLALSTVVRARDEGFKLPGSLILMSPALDFADEGGSHNTKADAPLLNKELAGLFTACYLGNTDRHDSRITPLYANLAGLPPVLLHVGTREFLLDDTLTLAERLHAANVQVDLRVWPGMCHSWQLFAPFLDEGMASIEQAGQFINTHFKANSNQ
ncbi:alpha/beta hydrolase [Gynuella sunshinyii]|uniref:Esterase/lipase n=1 Tax=Gynuella sunshinyii YC6258 TaxID=1445510 RepID=A0A0C5VER4_9GAMM|nr:alpha/beta hydrolase [Gynuella sunshinyii]AJQ92686.1 esterase/lipase [Gynuella sunshinyii YC6258]